MPERAGGGYRRSATSALQPHPCPGAGRTWKLICVTAKQHQQHRSRLCEAPQHRRDERRRLFHRQRGPAHLCDVLLLAKKLRYYDDYVKRQLRRQQSFTCGQTVHRAGGARRGASWPLARSAEKVASIAGVFGCRDLLLHLRCTRRSGLTSRSISTVC